MDASRGNRNINTLLSALISLKNRRYNRHETVACDDFICDFGLENRLLCLTFLVMLLYIVERTGNKEPDIRIMQQPYKRQYRELSDETKEKISAANRNRPKSEMHRQHISQAMKDYWAKVPHRPVSGDVTTYQGEENG